MPSVGRFARTWLAVAAFVAGLSSPFASARHFWGIDDPACGPSAPASAQSSQFREASPVNMPGHCAICHWQRAVGGASISPAHSIVVAAVVTDPHPAPPSSFVPSVVHSDRASRAPPLGA